MKIFKFKHKNGSATKISSGTYEDAKFKFSKRFGSSNLEDIERVEIIEKEDPPSEEKLKEERDKYFDCINEITNYISNTSNDFSNIEKYEIFNIIQKYDEKLAFHIKADVRN